MQPGLEVNIVPRKKLNLVKCVDLTNGQNFQQIVQANTSMFRYSYCLD